jgi:hypothetical protein
MPTPTIDPAAIKTIARRYNLSEEAIRTLLYALQQGNGIAAQFNHPELGGMGQWMAGGMTMVGDMFNHALKAKVDQVCTELSTLLRQTSGATTPAAEPQSRWWPAEFGSPTASGSQNSMRYAYFAQARRLAVVVHNHVTIYDTQDHRISGVMQQQAGSSGLVFTSQKGQVPLNKLPKTQEYNL